MNRYRNKVIYDPTTGQIKDERNHMSMLEDFWMPRREGGRGTEISTLDGGQNLGQMEDVQYLLQKLYRALGVPLSRMLPDTGFNMGRSAEITRDEVKFNKFIDRLRQRFSGLLLDLLKTQVILKGLMTEEDWNRINQDITFRFNQDSYFTELKNNDILRERLDIIAAVTPYIGKFFSEEYIRKNFLKQSEEDIIQIDAQINREVQKQLEAQEQQMYQQMLTGQPPMDQQQQQQQQPPPQ
jgi:predicted unusual protein kinase regulating ubiquinone biosynthesis (AarF/ABC1/UbiB family)